MRVRRLLMGIVFTALAAGAAPTFADELIMARVPTAFPEAMNALQEAIREQGYKLARVQRIDVGMSKLGYETAQYRVVFFGKPEQMERLPKRYPELIPFMPLKVTIFAELDETLLVTMNPATLATFFPDPALTDTFKAWEEDVYQIFARTRGD